MFSRLLLLDGFTFNLIEMYGAHGEYPRLHVRVSSVFFIYLLLKTISSELSDINFISVDIFYMEKAIFK